MVEQRVVRPGPRALAQLRVIVDEARAEVAESRRLDGLERNRLVVSQRHLLAALETYVRALDEAGLAAHPQLRAEVDLLRAVTGTPPRIS
jgi:hypothetical protein